MTNFQIASYQQMNASKFLQNHAYFDVFLYTAVDAKLEFLHLTLQPIILISILLGQAFMF